MIPIAIALVLLLNMATSALLLNAGVLKIASPGLLLRALDELGGTELWIRHPAIAYGFGGLEVATAILLLQDLTVTLAAGIVTAFGLCFIGLGIGGIARRSRRPCGCFGARSSTPLGLDNIVVGLALTASLPVNLLSTHPYAQAAVVLPTLVVAAAVICLGAWPHRGRALALMSHIGR